MNPLSWFSRSTFYVRFDASTCSVVHTRTHAELRQKPLVATRPGKGGLAVVVALGDDVQGLDDTTVTVVNPFGHERLVVHAFEHAQVLLRWAVARAAGTAVITRPVLVLHPLRALASGLTDVERRALLECAHAAGARHAVVHTGAELSLVEVDRLAGRARIPPPPPQGPAAITH